MTEPANGPQPIDWAIAAIRGLHPVRWALALLGILATLVAAAGLQAIYEGAAPDWAGWWNGPVENVRSLGNDIARRSFVANAVRIGVALAAINAAWCLIGAWIARHELLARRKGDLYSMPEPVGPGPSTLVVRQAKNLALCCPTSLALVALCLFPALLIGLLNHLGGVGAILVALVLPLLLVFNLIVLLLTIGICAWPLMAVTIAAENSDTFDALSRAYNYLLMRPFRFLVFMGIAIAVAAIPLAIVLVPLADVIAGLPPGVGQIVFWLAAGLSMSLFWSLSTLVYLHLRTAVDNTDVSELVVDPKSEPAPPATQKTETSKTEPTPGRIGTMPLLMLLMIVAWCLTVWLFRQTGGEHTEWLNWGLADGFVPRADGLYKVASLIAGLWAILWVSAPLVVSLRRWIKGDGAAAKTEVEKV